MKFRKDEEAVSPVIGVILMVAITVILAAVIAAFVFQMGTPIKTPTVNMQMKLAQIGTGNITLLHSGGEAVTLSDVKLVIYNSSTYKTTINPILPFGNPTALPPGSELKISYSRTTPYNLTSISIDGRPYTTFGTMSPSGDYYNLSTPGESVTIEFWYIPSGQLLGKVHGATIS